MQMQLVPTVMLMVTLAACVPSSEPPESGPVLPEIVAKAIDFHGGTLYEHSKIALTITSLSGSFQIEASRDGGNFEYVVTGRVGRDQSERKVRLTNDTVQEWINGAEIELDTESEQRTRAFANARVFFPFLPYTLKSKDIHFDDLGLETWGGRELRRMKVTFTLGTSNDADDAYTFWFDPDTGRIEQFGYDFSGGLRYRKAIAFNRVGGVLFSDQENYAVNGDRVPVDMLSPEYISENMVLLSTVAISDITVEPL